MDKITHEIWLSNRKTVIEQCSLRPEGQTVKQWLADNEINDKTYCYWQRRVRKEVFGQIDLPQAAGHQETVPVSFAEIPVIPVQAETSFHADAVIRQEIQLSVIQQHIRPSA